MWLNYKCPSYYSNSHCVCYFSGVDKKFKGLIDLVVDILRLHLLGDQVGDDGVDPEVQLLHGLLAVLAATLSALQTLKQDFDLKQSFVKSSSR